MCQNQNENLVLKTFLKCHGRFGQNQARQVGDDLGQPQRWREILNLPSTAFSLEFKQDKVIITTRGNGHRVGMSQYGANVLAKRGYSYDEILKYYYQNIEISNNQK